MKNIFKISALLATVACTSVATAKQPTQEQLNNEEQSIVAGGCVQNADTNEDVVDDVMRTIGGLPFRVESVDEAAGHMTALVAEDALREDLAIGYVIGSIGGETYRVESIESSEVPGYIRVVLSLVSVANLE